MASTSEFQTAKCIGDILSGQLGRGITGRSFSYRKPFNVFERTVGRTLALFALWNAVG